MTEPTNGQPNAEITQPTLWIIWGALLFSLVIYVGVAIFVRKANPTVEPNPSLDILTMAFGFISLTISGLVLIGAKLIFAKSMPFFTYSIIRWALSESIGIYGFVLFILGATFDLLLGFIIWGMILIILTRPSQSNLDKYLEARDTQ